MACRCELSSAVILEERHTQELERRSRSNSCRAFLAPNEVTPHPARFARHPLPQGERVGGARGSPFLLRGGRSAPVAQLRENLLVMFLACVRGGLACRGAL